MIVTFYRPQRYVFDMCDNVFVTSQNADVTALKVYDVDMLFVSKGTLVLNGKDGQAVIDTRLFTYFDVM